MDTWSDNGESQPYSKDSTKLLKLKTPAPAPASIPVIKEDVDKKSLILQTVAVNLQNHKH
jgi:hypothetical protein